MAETVKVRIAVAVNPDGNWGAVGWSESGGTEWECLENSVMDLEPGHRTFYVEAELPVPPQEVIPTVPGTVELEG